MSNTALDAPAIEAIEKLVRNGLEFKSVLSGHHDIAILPAGSTVVDLEKYFDSPRKVTESPALILRESFCDYVNRFKQITSVVFGSLSKGVFTGKLDYHYTPEQSGSNHSGPTWSTHNPTLSLKLHTDFKKLLENNDEPMTQMEFAEFIEDLAYRVVSPDQATIIETVTKFEAIRNVSFHSSPNRVNGNMIFEYKDELQTSGKVAVPEVIEFSVPVYEASEPQILVAQLRYRLAGSQLSFRYVIQQIDKIKRDAFDSVAEAIRQDTGLPVYITE